MDLDHNLKRAALHQARINVVAPFHPEFSPNAPITHQEPRKGPVRSLETSIPAVTGAVEDKKRAEIA